MKEEKKRRHNNCAVNVDVGDRIQGEPAHKACSWVTKSVGHPTVGNFVDDYGEGKTDYTDGDKQNIHCG